MEVERFKHRQLAPTVGPIVMITVGFEGPHHLDQFTDTAWLFINNSSCSIEHQFEINLLGADQSQLAVFRFKVDSTWSRQHHHNPLCPSTSKSAPRQPAVSVRSSKIRHQYQFGFFTLGFEVMKNTVRSQLLSA
jgi:hypothetical protein